MSNNANDNDDEMYDRRRRLLSLALIATITNASYTTIAPILPLEIDRHSISERWISLIFLAFSIGSSVAPMMVARHLESMGNVRVMSYSMAGMSVLFWCLGFAFDVAGWLSSASADDYDSSAQEGTGSDDDDDDDDDGSIKSHGFIVGLLTLLQFFLGACFSVITTSYYSLATLAFTEKESAMSSIEAAVGTGYILGPILGSVIYDELGFRYAYAFISMGMMVMAFVTSRFLSPHLAYKTTELVIDNADDITSNLEAQNSGLGHYNSFENSGIEGERGNAIREKQSTLNIDDSQENSSVRRPSFSSLLKHRNILIAATNIMWINVSWTFIEPLLAKRLDNYFQIGKKEIGLIFSLSNIVYVPTVFLVQYLPKHHRWRHRIISTSTILTPMAVLLVGSNVFSLAVLGIALIGLLPTPVWIMLLPFMQEESTNLYPEPSSKRSVNDITAGIYNSFMTLGQVVGYTLGPLLGSFGFAMTTHVVALLIFLQSMLFYFGTEGRKKRISSSSYSLLKD